MTARVLLLGAALVLCLERVCAELGLPRGACANAFGRQLMQRKFAVEAGASGEARPETELPLKWRVLREFPPFFAPSDPRCSMVGRRFPRLVSRDPKVLGHFYEYACGEGRDFFITDPTAFLTATIADLANGCVELTPWPTSILATNGTHGASLYRPGENSPEDFTDKLMLEHEVLVISTMRSWPGMVYQHTLLDFLAPFWTAWKDGEFSISSVKVVAGHSLQANMLRLMGVPEDRIQLLPLLGNSLTEPRLRVCSPRLHLWRMGDANGAALPSLPKHDGKIYSDFWHRLINWQVGREVSDVAIQRAGIQDSFAGHVVFLQRCSQKRKIANEQDALKVTSAALIRANRSELLTSVCAGREDFLEQIREMRKAHLIIGQHGGSLSDILFAPREAGIVEFVGSAAAHRGLPGVWPPYKSYWYGGAGAAFSFFRVVLYEVDGSVWKLRLEDLDAALEEWLSQGKQQP